MSALWCHLLINVDVCSWCLWRCFLCRLKEHSGSFPSCDRWLSTVDSTGPLTRRGWNSRGYSLLERAILQQTPAVSRFLTGRHSGVVRCYDVVDLLLHRMFWNSVKVFRRLQPVFVTVNTASDWGAISESMLILTHWNPFYADVVFKPIILLFSGLWDKAPSYIVVLFKYFIRLVIEVYMSIDQVPLMHSTWHLKTLGLSFVLTTLHFLSSLKIFYKNYSLALKLETFPSRNWKGFINILPLCCIMLIAI